MKHETVGLNSSVFERNSPSFEMSDEGLVLAYLEHRDPKSFEILVRRFERELYAFLKRFLGDEQQAEDVFQLTFITVHQRLNQFEQGRRFRPWLYAIATNKAIDFKRHLKRRATVSLDAVRSGGDSDAPVALASTVVSHEPDPFEVVANRETRQRVSDLLAQQSDEMQVLLQMVFYQGMKYSDISEALGIPIGTVKSRVFNAMRKLNESWRRIYPNSPPGF